MKASSLGWSASRTKQDGRELVSVSCSVRCGPRGPLPKRRDTLSELIQQSHLHSSFGRKKSLLLLSVPFFFFLHFFKNSLTWKCTVFKRLAVLVKAKQSEGVLFYSGITQWHTVRPDLGPWADGFAQSESFQIKTRSDPPPPTGLCCTCRPGVLIYLKSYLREPL